MASVFLALRQVPTAVLSPLVYRREPIYRTQVFLGRLRCLLYGVWRPDLLRWTKVGVVCSCSWVSFLLTVSDRFRSECKAAGKNLMVWTVNRPEHMMEVRLLCISNADNSLRCGFFCFCPQAVRWEVNAIITDVTKTWLDLRAALHRTLCVQPYLL